MIEQEIMEFGTMPLIQIIGCIQGEEGMLKVNGVRIKIIGIENSMVDDTILLSGNTSGSEKQRVVWLA
jgi:hypothetical protein